MSEQKVCPTCGAEYPLSERFCPRDGTALRGANPMADLVGQVVAERYHVIKRLGEGGMGTVYLAEHVKMGRKSALKVMNPGMAQDADAIARFNREAANASRLNHPNICAIYDFGETPDGLIYLAMEFIEGRSLTSLVEQSGALSPPRAAAIIHQAADALAVAHDAGIVHRDLKPDNIMVARGRDGSDVAKVVDFGIAKASSSDAQKVTKTGLVVGTPEYMSPEQLAGDKLDGRSDIYSLGLVAFNCLTGTLPFPSNSAQEAMIMRLTDHPRTLAEMKPDVEWPAALQAVMDRALARDAADRYQDAREFGREIAKAVENMPQAVASEAGTQVIGAPTAALPATRVAAGGATAKVGASRPGPSSTAAALEAAPVAERKRNPVPLIGGGAAVVVIAVVGFLMMRPGSSSAPPAPDAALAAQPTGAAQQAGGQSTSPSVPSAPIGGGANGRTSRGETKSQAAPAGSQARPETSRPSASGGAPAPASGGAAAPALNADAELARLSKTLDIASADKAAASQATSRLDQIIASGVTGEQLGMAYYLRGLAHGTLEDEAALCSDMRRARPLVTASKPAELIATLLRDTCR